MIDPHIIQLVAVFLILGGTTLLIRCFITGLNRFVHETENRLNCRSTLIWPCSRAVTGAETGLRYLESKR